jgi:hypothetical protein
MEDQMTFAPSRFFTDEMGPGMIPAAFIGASFISGSQNMAVFGSVEINRKLRQDKRKNIR